MREETRGGLTVRLTGGEDREGGGEGPAVVLLHGFGAPGDDLVPLWRVIDVPEAVRFVFPEGPLALDANWPKARAWWMLDLERLMSSQTPVRNVRVTPPGLADARERLQTALLELETSLNLSPHRMILGGFSQGAMLACDVVLRSPQSYAGLIILSGTLIARDDWEALPPARKGLPVFQSHGTRDPLLPFDMAQELRDLFTVHGLAVEWHEFEGGHEIPYHVLTQLGTFIRRTFQIS
ncbi:MAG: phospholipase [Nitrospirae bacterium]|nr:MAG: phospholipase [Nitrospirota bacterium]